MSGRPWYLASLHRNASSAALFHTNVDVANLKFSLASSECKSTTFLGYAFQAQCPIESCNCLISSVLAFLYFISTQRQHYSPLQKCERDRAPLRLCNAQGVGQLWAESPSKRFSVEVLRIL